MNMLEIIGNKKKKENQILYEMYPWLKVTTTIEKYIYPDYYERLLKDYIFNNKSDLEIFEEYLKKFSQKNSLKALELGCGSGRATKVFLSNSLKKRINLKLVDLSERMLSFCRDKFISHQNITYIKSDLIEFLKDNENAYDLIFSLWSFSHSVHQILTEKGLNQGRRYVQSVIEKTIDKNMVSGSSFFLMHFDSLSDEQKILMQQWKKVYPIFNNINMQSPSKILIDETLRLLSKKGLIKTTLKHYKGEAIKYSCIEEALEIFLNFHLESYFNKSKFLPTVLNELVNYFKKFTNKNGIIKIQPGCFVYLITKK